MINSRTLVAIFASLAFALTFASCEQTTDPITPEPQPTPPTPIDKELAGIQFLSEAGYTQEEIDAITAELLALYGNNDLAGLSEYVKSLTFRPSADGRTVSLVGADGEQVATIITNSAGRVQILGDLHAGRDAAREANYVPTPGPDYIDTEIGGIEFVTASSVEFSEEQVAAIQAQLDTLDEAAVASFAEYVERVTFGQNVQGEDGENFIIDVNTGEDATAVIYINYDATAAEIKAALDAAQEKVAAERERARIEREAEEELARQASVIDELSTEFAGYISSITFADVEVPGYQLDVDSDPVTASVTLPLNFTAEQGRAFIENTVMESIESARDVDTNEPVDFLTLSFEGRETVLRAAPGIDQATIDAIRTTVYNEFNVLLDDGDRRVITSRIASWTLVEEAIDGGLKIDFVNGGRATITSNNSSADDWAIIEEIFLTALQVGARGAMQAMGTNALTVSSR